MFLVKLLRIAFSSRIILVVNQYASTTISLYCSSNWLVNSNILILSRLGIYTSYNTVITNNTLLYRIFHIESKQSLTKFIYIIHCSSWCRSEEILERNTILQQFLAFPSWASVMCFVVELHFNVASYMFYSFITLISHQ